MCEADRAQYEVYEVKELVGRYEHIIGKKEFWCRDIQVISGSAQIFSWLLHSVIINGSAQGTVWDAQGQTWIDKARRAHYPQWMPSQYFRALDSHQ